VDQCYTADRKRLLNQFMDTQQLLTDFSNKVEPLL